MSKKHERKLRNKLDAALSRAANGTATLNDVDFITRMRREAEGKEGYSGNSRFLTVSSTHSTTPASVSVAPSANKDNGFVYHRNNQGSDHGSWGHWGGEYQSHQPYSGYKSSYKGSSRGSKTDEGVFCTTSSEVIKDCPIAKTPSILIPGAMWDCWLRLTEAFDTEWIALFFGKLDKDKDNEAAYIVTGFYFPPQTASGAHVDVPTGIKPRPGVIGAVHSHVNMGVFFSSTDIAHSNWPVEIVINRRKEYKAVARHQLKCGEWAKNDSTVYLVQPMMSTKVKSRLEDAFKSGALIEERNRKASKGSKNAEVVETSVTMSIIPAGVAADDVEDVQDSLFKNQRCNNYHVVNRQIVFCNRLANHPGKCRDNGEVYFEPVTHTSDLSTSTNSPNPSTDSSTTSDSTTTTTSITSPLPDDGSALFNQALDNHEDLEDADYCLKCEGIGLVDGVDNTAVVCSECKGSGLTEAGKKKVEEKDRERMIE